MFKCIKTKAQTLLLTLMEFGIIPKSNKLLLAQCGNKVCVHDIRKISVELKTDKIFKREMIETVCMWVCLIAMHDYPILFHVDTPTLIVMLAVALLVTISVYVRFNLELTHRCLTLTLLRIDKSKEGFIDDKDELLVFVNKWNEKQTATTYFIDYGTVVLLGK